MPAYLSEVYLLSDYALTDPLQNFCWLNVADSVLAARGFRHSAVAVRNSLEDIILDSSNIDILNVRLKHVYLLLHPSPSTV